MVLDPRAASRRQRGTAPSAAAGQGRPDVSWSALKRAWRALGRRIPDMRADLACYAAVQSDRARLLGARLGQRLAVGILAVFATAALLATAAWLALSGAAGGLATVLDGKAWLANLLTGVAAFVVLFGASAVRTRVQDWKRLRRLRRRYASHDARQRAMDVAATIANGSVPDAKRN